MIFNMAGGGGTSLNFTVVGGTSQPSSPKENTIWVNTSTTITSWVFSAEQPTSRNRGMVWIEVGNSSDLEFNALKKNEMRVYPLAVKQYVSYTWQEKTCQFYQNGSWQELISDYYLYRNGNQYTSLTGGWSGYMHSSSDGYVTFNENNVTMNGGKGWYAAICTNKPIDLSQFYTLIIELEVTARNDSDDELYFGIASSIDNLKNINFVAKQTVSLKNNISLSTISCDISSCNNGYVGIYAKYVFNAIIHKIWLV